MSYEVFKRTGTRVDAPTLAITKDKRIAINAAAVRVLLEAGVRFVLLLWDKTNNRMALKAALKGDKNAYVISLAPDKRAGTVRAKAFLDYIGWNASRREVFPAGWNA